MTALDLTQLLDAARMPKAELARALNVTPRTLDYWTSGERAIPAKWEDAIRAAIARKPTRQDARLVLRSVVRKLTMAEGCYGNGDAVRGNKLLREALNIGKRGAA